MPRPSSPVSSLNASYVESLEATYLEDPTLLTPDWRLVFDVLRDLDAVGHAADGERSGSRERLRRDGHLLAALSPVAMRDGRARSVDTRGLVDELLRIPEGQRKRYSGSLAVETGHIDDRALREWIHQRFEAQDAPLPSTARMRALEKLIEADEFERFLASRFPGKKRFGAEGCEVVVAMLDRLLAQAAAGGVEAAFVGTMHRARMNLMVNVLGKSVVDLLREFKGRHPFGGRHDIAADVPYHLGLESRFDGEDGGLAISLSPNPSHLEAIDAVVAGRARACADRLPQPPRNTLPIVLHTDSSVAGQGVVSETLQLSAVEGFSNAGTIHLVINNQIGFTTDPGSSRSSLYCTGPWKAIDSLILHVNADDVEACLRAVDLALSFRQTHARDAVIDLICYRRNGHNEFDEPRFTQPRLHAHIETLLPVADRYSAMLTEEGLANASDVGTLRHAVRARLHAAYVEASASVVGGPASDATGVLAERARVRPDTGVMPDTLDEISESLVACPAGMALHPTLERTLCRQRDAWPSVIAWAQAEALAFGSLLREGISIRLTGQDVTRGAFSHRHLAWFDQDSGERVVPLARLARGNAAFDVHDSPLSEYATLAFEYGYSLDSRRSLVIWEAQFGDFANGAQIVLDQFIASGEEKWLQASHLVVLLPHGLEGQGPEHSSARIERVLQLAAKDNLRIAHPTTPANYFHLLRDQALAVDRKPLIVFTPKTLLRLPAAVSTRDELAPGQRFCPLQVSGAGDHIACVLLCNGKVAYDLRARCDEESRSDVAIVSLEQLYPLPEAELGTLFARWPQARYAWVQEEPRNMGAWSYMDRRLEAVMHRAGVESTLRCVSRPEAASPAGSFHAAHASDQEWLLAAAFAVG